jgi:hypothetical protein
MTKVQQTLAVNEEFDNKIPADAGGQQGGQQRKSSRRWRSTRRSTTKVQQTLAVDNQVDNNKSSKQTLAINNKVKNTKSSRHWPSTTRLTINYKVNK